jgi:hypothetical protein
MTTPDFPDWTQPVGTAPRTKTVLAQGAYLCGFVQHTGIALDGYGRLIVFVQYPTAGAVGDRYAVTATWGTGTFPGHQETVTFHSGQSYQNNPYGFILEIPIGGSNVDIGVFGPNGAGVNLGAVATSTPLAVSKLSPWTPGTVPLLGKQSTVAVPASGSSAPIYIPPTDRAVQMFIGGSGTTCVYRLRGVYLATTVLAADILADYPASNSEQNQVTLAPRTGLEALMVNTDSGAAHNALFNVWDVS